MNRPVNLDTHNSAGDELVAQGDLSRRRFMAKTASTLGALSAPTLVGVGALTAASPALAWNHWHQINVSHQSAHSLLQLYYPPSIADDDRVSVEINWRAASGSSNHIQANMYILRTTFSHNSPQVTIIANPFLDYWETYTEVPGTTISSQYTPVLKNGGENGGTYGSSRELAIFPWQASQDWMDKFFQLSGTGLMPIVTITGDTDALGVQIVQYAFIRQGFVEPNYVMYLVQLDDPQYGHQMYEGGANNTPLPESSMNNLQNKVVDCGKESGALTNVGIYTAASTTLGTAAFVLINTVLHARASANAFPAAGVAIAILMGYRYGNQYATQWSNTLLAIRAQLQQMMASGSISRVDTVQRQYWDGLRPVPPTDITDLNNPLNNYVKRGRPPLHFLFD